MPYHRLEVYKKAYQLSLEIHKETLKFPKLEQYELASQLRRSSKSIVANLVEGMGKQSSQREVKRYIRIAIGSADESRIWLEYARDLGYMERDKQQGYERRYQEIGRMLTGLKKRYERSDI